MNSKPALLHGKQPVGYFYTWWHGDPLPPLPPVDGLAVYHTSSVELLAQLSDCTDEDVEQRLARGHQPYLAVVDDDPVAYGWSAWREAAIGELGIQFELPAGERYLWDFVTLSNWRGYGIYRRMLQEILRIESPDAERFWIGHDLDNIASAKGIEKAGFPVIGEVWVGGGQAVFVPREPIERAEIAAKRLGLRLVRWDGCAR